MTTTYSKLTSKPILAALAIALSMSSVSPALYAADNLKEDVTINEYQGWGNPAMASIAVNAGRALVNHLRSADALLTDGDSAQARSALQTSQDFTASIERMMPYLQVVDEMKDASNKIVSEDIETLSVDMLPIYASLDNLQIYAPKVAQKTRTMVKQAEKHSTAGRKREAVTVLKEAEDIISQHTVYLPVKYVDQQVRVALSAINQPRPDIKTAKQAVERAMDSITTVVDEVVVNPVS